MLKEDNAFKLSQYLLQIKAIEINVQNPFTWASGWQSPIYSDNRQLLSFPDVRNFVKSSFLELIKAENLTFDAIAGVATAGIPHAAIIADALNVPMIYVRSQPKGHGRKNAIEGHLKDNWKVLVVEDVVSTGGSSLKAVDVLRTAGAEVTDMLCIYTYGFDVAEAAMRQASVNLSTLTNYQCLLKAALNEDLISEDQMNTLNLWREQPASWVGK